MMVLFLYFRYLSFRGLCEERKWWKTAKKGKKSKFLTIITSTTRRWCPSCHQTETREPNKRKIRSAHLKTMTGKSLALLTPIMAPWFRAFSDVSWQANTHTWCRPVSEFLNFSQHSAPWFKSFSAWFYALSESELAISTPCNKEKRDPSLHLSIHSLIKA